MDVIATDRRPFVLVWELTQACDLSCDHCRAEAQPQRHSDELTTTEGKQLLDEAREFGDGQLVVLSGGDPCKRPDLVELVDYGTDIGLTVTLTPSGTSALTPEKIDRLAEAGLSQLALSIDGATVNSHDDFRGEAGSFAETISAARGARAADIPLQINTTVCQRTVEELPGIRDLIADLGTRLWSVFFLVPVGRGRVLDPITPDRSDEVMAWLADVESNADFAIKTTEAPHYRRVVQQRNETGNSTSRRGGIVAGDGFAFVSHVGKVYPSGFLPESAGNVRHQSILDIYRDAELFQQLRNRDALKGKCGACPFKQICGGSRSRAYAYTGDPLSSDPLCPYIPPGYDGPLPDGQLP